MTRPAGIFMSQHETIRHPSPFGLVSFITPARPSLPVDAMPHVLIVDDDADVREVLATALEDAGVCHVETVSSAAEALALLGRMTIEAVIIDATMPRVSGLELARQTIGDGIPTLLISGDPKYLETVPELGCPFLAKPFRAARLQAEVEALLDEARRRAGGGMATGAAAD